MFRAIGFDPVHAVQGCIQMFTGQLFPGASVLTAVINPALSDDVRITVRPIPPSKN
jgi:hypothetical protein